MCIGNKWNVVITEDNEEMYCSINQKYNNIVLISIEESTEDDGGVLVSKEMQVT